MEDLSKYSVALGYKQSSLSMQKEDGVMFVQTDVTPRAGDVILDLGCGTGELSAYLAELVGPKGKVVGVDPDKERILLAKQTYSEVKNLSFMEGSASNFRGIGMESYDIIFSNHVIHWIPDKQEVFKNEFKSLNRGGKICVQYIDRLFPFVLDAFKELNPETAERICNVMYQCEEKSKIEQYCSLAGFNVIKSYYTKGTPLAFQSIESLLKWLSTTTHGVFDPKLVTKERLQRFYPYSSRDGKQPFILDQGRTEETSISRLIAVKKS